MLFKKIIGTFMLMTCIVGASLAAQSFARANNGQSSNYQINGTLETKTASSVTVLSAQGNRVTIWIDEDTVFVGNIGLADIERGDSLKINVREQNSAITAKTIKKVQDGCGYGNDGEEYTVHISTSATR